MSKGLRLRYAYVPFFLEGFILLIVTWHTQAAQLFILIRFLGKITIVKKEKMTKIWRKPLHKRKVWKEMSLISQIIYYMRPFLENFIEIWLEPLPFPTILKIVYSGVLSFFLILPIMYPTIICFFYFGLVQYFVESALGISFPHKLDLLHWVGQAFTQEIPNLQCEQFIMSYIEKCRYVLTLASCVDYMRLAITLFIG